MNKNFKPKKKKISPDISPDDLPTNNKSNINWFPGHMMKAMKKIKERLKSVDIIVEIRDARSPLATGNKVLTSQIGNKSHLIVMNKTNLANPETVKLWEEWFSQKGNPYIFINGLEKKSLNQIIQLAKDVVHKNIRESNPNFTPKTKLKMMVIGLPNTGKSTIINRLANRDASKVADRPGQTQQQLWVNASKDLEILDTPGVMPPNIESHEQALWLSALHAIPERVTDTEDTACYIIRHILKYNPENLCKHYKVEEKKYELVEMLDEIAKRRGLLRKKNEYDYDRVYKLVISDFRSGDLGLISFGVPPKIK